MSFLSFDFLFVDVSRVVIQDFFADSCCVDMSIYLCGSNALMAEHALYGPQVCPSFQQMSGKGMTECMWTDTLVYTSTFCQFFDDIEYHDAGQCAASPETDENIIFVSRFYGDMDPFGKPEIQFLDCFFGDGYQAFLVAFSFDADKPFIKIQAGEFQLT